MDINGSKQILNILFLRFKLDGINKGRMRKWFHKGGYIQISNRILIGSFEDGYKQFFTALSLYFSDGAFSVFFMAVVML